MVDGKIRVKIAELELDKIYEVPSDTCVVSTIFFKCTKSHKAYEYLYIVAILDEKENFVDWYPKYCIKYSIMYEKDGQEIIEDRIFDTGIVIESED